MNNNVDVGRRGRAQQSLDEALRRWQALIDSRTIRWGSSAKFSTLCEQYREGRNLSLRQAAWAIKIMRDTGTDHRPRDFDVSVDLNGAWQMGDEQLARVLPALTPDQVRRLLRLRAERISGNGDRLDRVATILRMQRYAHPRAA